MIRLAAGAGGQIGEDLGPLTLAFAYAGAIDDDPVVVDGDLCGLPDYLQASQHVVVDLCNREGKLLPGSVVLKPAYTLGHVLANGVEVYAVGEFRVVLLQAPQLGATYRSPRCPEVEEDWLPLSRQHVRRHP